MIDTHTQLNQLMLEHLGMLVLSKSCNERYICLYRCERHRLVRCTPSACNVELPCLRWLMQRWKRVDVTDEIDRYKSYNQDTAHWRIFYGLMTDETSHTQFPASQELADQIAAVAHHVSGSAPDDGWTLAAIVPCELVIGRVAMITWVSPERNDPMYEWALISLDTGHQIDDHAAIRDACALIAMHESLAEPLERDRIDDLALRVNTWISSSSDASETSTLTSQLAHVSESLGALSRACPSGTEPLLARSDVLDTWGGLLRNLERAVDSVDLHAERWSQQAAEHEPELVRSLWMLLADVRGSVIAQPVSMRLQAGREAGLALAADVLGAST